jgi:hypothetical protein
LFIGGCSLTPFNPFADEPKLEVNAAVGKNVKQEKSKIKVEQGGQEAETISNDTKQMADTISNVTQNIPPWVFYSVLAIVGVLCGWVIPQPGECGRMFKLLMVESYLGVRVIITDALSLVVTPCRGVADFILKLFGGSVDEAKNQNSK